MKKGDLERIFHFLIAEDILKEVYLQNSMGFTSGYLAVRDIPLHLSSVIAL